MILYPKKDVMKQKICPARPPRVCAGGGQGTRNTFPSHKAGIDLPKISQIIGMRKIKQDPLEKTREERETCFPEAGRADLHPAARERV